jgi:two-component system sensor histidine kinase RegB
MSAPAGPMSNDSFRRVEPFTGAATLVRLRWWLIASEILAVGFTARVVQQDVRLAPLSVLILVQLGTNFAIPFLRQRSSRADEALLSAFLAFDIACLTSVIHFSGGPTNPFSSLFVIHTIVAVIVLRPRLSAIFAALSCVGYATVLLLATGGDFGHDALTRIGASMHVAIGGHLVGMWLSLALTVAAVTIFGGQLVRRLRENERNLARLRADAAEAARIASLTSFAAGAAHELSTPLSTIAIVAGELSRHAAATGAGEIESDLDLIRSEVGRCQRIIQSLRFDLEEPHGRNGVPLSAVLREELSLLLGDAILARVQVAESADVSLDGLPIRGLAHALAALVRNAVDASPRDEPVRIDLVARPDRIAISVRDRGQGIAPDVLPRILEPFYTTKPTGEALGLGLFLARVICDQLRAEMRIESEVGKGTVATIEIPRLGRDR